MAQAKDVTAIRDLARSCIVSSIPATRDAPPEEVQAFCEANYQDLAETLKSDRNFLILVEEDSNREITGYLMLDFGHVEASTGERQCFIVDLGVRQDKRGRFATHRLIKKASQLVKAKGLKYLVGVVSSNNDRTLQLGLKALDFEVERVQIVRRC